MPTTGNDEPVNLLQLNRTQAEALRFILQYIRPDFVDDLAMAEAYEGEPEEDKEKIRGQIAVIDEALRQLESVLR